MLLSDVTAAAEWELAASAVEFLHLPMPEDEDEPEAAGDLDLLGDLGLHAMDLAALLDDEDLYPDEMLVRRRPPARVRRALRRRRRPHRRREPRSTDRWREPMLAALAEARAALATGDVPIGAVVVDAAGAVSAPVATCARPTPTRPATPRWSRCARPRAAAGSGGSTAAPWW